MIVIKQNTVIVDLPILVTIGDEFNMPEELFISGSVGRVIEILGQSNGRTKVRMELIQGKPKSRKERNNIKNNTSNFVKSVENIIKENTNEVEESKNDTIDVDDFIAGGLDPRPRTGTNNQIITESQMDGQTEQIKKVLEQISTPISQGTVWRPQIEKEMVVLNRNRRRRDYIRKYDNKVNKL